MALCLPISSTTNEFDIAYTTLYFYNQPTTFSGTTINSEIPSTTENELTHNPEIVPIEETTEILNRIDLNGEHFKPASTESNYLHFYIADPIPSEDESDEVIDEILSTIIPTEVPDNFDLISTSTEKEREITTKRFIEVQTTPVRLFTRISKTTRIPYNKRVEIITQKMPKYLTHDEMRIKYGANSKFKFTENLFYILSPVVVVAIVGCFFYVKRINEI